MGKNKVDIHNEIKKALNEMEKFGQSKASAKANGTFKEGIYSYSTMKYYSRAGQQFANYVKEHSPTGRYTTLEDAKAYAKDYIAERIESGLSPYTVKLDAAALAKIYRCSSKEFGYTGTRHRADITRSRDGCSNRFSESKHPELVAFAKGTGLRRSEMEAIRGTDLVVHDGIECIYVNNGKGGKERFAPIREGYRNVVSNLCRSAGEDKVFERIPKDMPCHYYRSVYACEMYRSLVRSEIPKVDRYYCRGDLKGMVYDKAAMLPVSKALGHNRISVIASNYLWQL